VRTKDTEHITQHKLFRTVSQRSCSINSTSLNTCSSVCSMQPSQQPLFRYFDSDMAKKRPLVVSFRRVQKMVPNNCSTTDRCNSFCVVQRLDTNKSKDNDIVTMKLHSKYNTNTTRNLVQKGGGFCCGENQSSRNFHSMNNNNNNNSSNSNNNYKKRALFELFDGDKSHSYQDNNNKNVFPKEKFYGSAQLQLGHASNDDILRKVAVIDCSAGSPFDRQVESKQNVNRKICFGRKLTKDNRTINGGLFSKNDIDEDMTTPQTSILSPPPPRHINNFLVLDEVSENIVEDHRNRYEPSACIELQAFNEAQAFQTRMKMENGKAKEKQRRLSSPSAANMKRFFDKDEEKMKHASF